MKRHRKALTSHECVLALNLGLSLVRRIIRRFGGNVRIENRSEHGTRVTLDLVVAA